MPNREIVSFRSCVRARRGEAKLRERDMESVARARRGKVCLFPSPRVKSVCGVVPGLSRRCVEGAYKKPPR